MISKLVFVCLFVLFCICLFVFLLFFVCVLGVFFGCFGRLFSSLWKVCVGRCFAPKLALRSTYAVIALVH